MTGGVSVSHSLHCGYFVHYEKHILKIWIGSVRNSRPRETDGTKLKIRGVPC